MKKRMFLYVLIVVGVAVHFPGLRIYAKETLPDEIRLENEAYEKHKKSIVVFSHKQHAETYAQKLPGLYAAGCGECHHDENNNPLQLKPGNDVKGCIECHANPGSMPSKEKKAMRKEKLSKAEKKSKKLAYHAEALHYNCRGCHKIYNKENKLKSKDKNAAPTGCRSCHPRK